MMFHIVSILWLTIICEYLSANVTLTNLALRKYAYQIDTRPEGGAASRAVDGNTTQDFSKESCTHTATWGGAWWEVDLGHIYKIDHITVYNRICGHCEIRLHRVQLYIGNGTNSTLEGYHDGNIYSKYTFQFTPPIYGRFVKFARNASVTNSALTLCEVEVYGEDHSKVLPNVAVGKTAYQTDIYGGAGPDRAVDGDTNGLLVAGSCTHTYTGSGAWWKVDLGDVYRIDHVTVFNRFDAEMNRLHDVQLYISYDDNDYSLKGYHAGAVGVSMAFWMSPDTYGRWVKITRLSGTTHLTLCEVQVFAENSSVKLELIAGEIGTGSVIRSSQARSVMECIAHCRVLTVGCNSVNYRPDSGICDSLGSVSSSVDSSGSNTLFYRYP